MTDEYGAEGATNLPTEAAIAALVGLADLAREPHPVTISTEGLGAGLPAVVPAMWDGIAQRIVGLRETIEAHRQAPARRTGTAHAQTIRAFMDLLMRHRDADSVVFADVDWRSPSLLAVIDYHRRAEAEVAHEARHLGHRIRYDFPISDAWAAWRDRDGKAMDQAEFAAFVEDHIAELASPTADEKTEAAELFQTRCAEPADVFKLARGLEVCVDSRVKQSVRLQSGEGELHFDEVHTDGKGERLVVPGLFMIRLALFRMADPVRLPVRLRYRVKGGAVIWSYQIHRPDERVTEAVLKALDSVRYETEVPVYEGKPEA